MVIYVNANAPKEGNGSKETPFRHINDAAKAARPGDEVLVAPGIYREYVDPVHGGTEDARITSQRGTAGSRDYRSRGNEGLEALRG